MRLASYGPARHACYDPCRTITPSPGSGRRMNTPEPERNPYSVSPATMQAAQASAESNADPTSLQLGAELYSSRQIFVAAFIGAPFAGAWFMSKNYRSLNL